MVMIKNSKIVIFILSLYITFVGFVISQIPLMDMRVKEFASLITSIGIILIPIQLFIFFKTYKIIIDKPKGKRDYLLISFIISSFLIMSIVTVYLLNVHVSKIYTYSNVIEHSSFEKIEKGNKFYIDIKNDDLIMKIKCSKNQYDELSLNKNYILLYKWSNFSPNEGKLLKIYLNEKQ